MRNRWVLGSVAGGLIAATLIAFPGCGSSEASGDSSSEEIQVDPRFASAEALLEHYNKLTYEPKRVDPGPLYELVYAENAKQQQLLRVFKKTIPVAVMNQDAWDRFGETVSETPPPLAPNLAPSRMVKVDADRAEATETHGDGATKTLYMVRIGDRWWISGYTLEYDRELDQYAGDLPAIEASLEQVTPAANSITTRMRNNEFSRIEEVRIAFASEMMKQ